MGQAAPVAVLGDVTTDLLAALAAVVETGRFEVAVERLFCDDVCG
jgi:hypothetical protein